MKWEMVKLGDVCDVIGGYAFKSENFKDEGIPLLRISNIINGEISFKDDCVCVEDSNLKSLLKFKVIKGDILVALSGATTGKFGVYKLKKLSFLNQRVGLIRAKEKTNQQYLLYYLNILKPQIEQIAQGAAQPNISTSEISNLQIPLPPLAVQKRIAEILDAADALRRKDQELLKKYDELAQAIFIDMFGDPVRNEKGWEVKRLDELLLKGEKISYGVVQPGDDYSNGIPIVRVGDFKLMKIDKTNLKKINPEIEKAYNRTRLKGDEILIACVGSVGKIALADHSLKGFNIVRATAKVRVDENIINRTYLAFHLNQKSIQNYFISETRTSSQPTLNIKQIEETKILVPPIKIQNEFYLLSKNLLKQNEIIHDSKTDSLFQTLLLKAFKGEL